MLGQCHYKLAEYAQAAEQLEGAVTELESDPEFAANCAWAVFQAYQQLAKHSPEVKMRARSLLMLICARFPEHDIARQADLQLNKMDRNQQGLETWIDYLRQGWK